MKLLWEEEFLGHKITFLGVYMGADLNVMISGGDRAHIGSVSTAIPGGNQSGSENDAIVSAYVYPGHRDDVIGSLFAKELCRKLGCHVAVSCGIHYDGLTPQQLEELLETCGEMLQNILEE